MVLNIGDVESTDVYREFLRVPSLSLGVYSHEAGACVPQTPHTEDEVYVVISGRGAIEIDGAKHDVMSGSVVYVPAGAEHHFCDVSESLRVLVAFAPPEGTQKTREPR